MAIGGIWRKLTGAEQVEDPPFARYLFTDPSSAGLWLAIRFYIGWEWINAARHKLVSSAWMSDGSALQAYWVRASAIPEKGQPAITYGWYRDLLEFMLDHDWFTWFAKLVTLGELFVGIALVLGAFVGIAAFFGAMMNFNYMLAGSASTNPVLFTMAILLILAWKVAGRLGLDRWLLPALGTPWRPGGLFRRGAEITDSTPRAL